MDDNALNVRLLAEVLGRNAHFSVTSAFNGQEALDIFRENYFEYVVMDLDMPIMNGLTASMEMRKVEERRRIMAREGGGEGEVVVGIEGEDGIGGGSEEGGGVRVRVGVRVGVGVGGVKEGVVRTKIIILSGTSEESCSERKEMSKVDVFLQKPVNIPLLWGHLGGRKKKKGKRREGKG